MSSHGAEEVRKSFTDYLRRKAISGRELDDAFTQAGFFAVEGERNYVENMFGATNHNSSFDSSLSDARLERRRAIHDQWLEKISAQKDRGDLKIVLDEMLESPDVHAEDKYFFLRRFSPDMLRTISQHYIDDFQLSIEKEQAKICVLYPQPAIDLSSASTKKDRKKIYNAVSGEAFGRLGFNLATKNDGLHTYEKSLLDDIVIFVSIDSFPFSKSYPKDYRIGSEYWFDIPLEVSIRVEHVDERNAARELFLNSRIESIAERRMRRYEDSCSLEAAIRYNAFWYELIFLPFENQIRASGSP